MCPPNLTFRTAKTPHIGLESANFYQKMRVLKLIMSISVLMDIRLITALVAKYIL